MFFHNQKLSDIINKLIKYKIIEKCDVVFINTCFAGEDFKRVHQEEDFYFYYNAKIKILKIFTTIDSINERYFGESNYSYFDLMMEDLKYLLEN